MSQEIDTADLDSGPQKNEQEFAVTKDADYEEVIVGNPKPLAISSITVASNIIKALESLQQTL